MLNLHQCHNMCVCVWYRTNIWSARKTYTLLMLLVFFFARLFIRSLFVNQIQTNGMSFCQFYLCVWSVDIVCYWDVHTWSWELNWIWLSTHFILCWLTYTFLCDPQSENDTISTKFHFFRYFRLKQLSLYCTLVIGLLVGSFHFFLDCHSSSAITAISHDALNDCWLFFFSLSIAHLGVT